MKKWLIILIGIVVVYSVFTILSFVDLSPGNKTTKAKEYIEYEDIDSDTSIESISELELYKYIDEKYGYKSMLDYISDYYGSYEIYSYIFNDIDPEYLLEDIEEVYGIDYISDYLD